MSNIDDHLGTLRRYFRQQGYPKLVERVWRAAARTPRRQTGLYKTNRETRWKLNLPHPEFSTKQECKEVAAKLLAQVLEFDGAPTPTEPEVIESATAVLGYGPTPGRYRCPISGRRLSFQQLVESTDISPVHGRSPIAVGHLHPIAQQGRNVAENVTWVHELGNRVQGDNSIDEAIREIFRMAEFHRQRMKLNWEEVEKLASRTMHEE
jgi:hypothetical protein